MAFVYPIEFYQNLGKLFYAISSSDKVVRPEEYTKLKDIVKKDWISSSFIEDAQKKNAEASIINTFNWLETDKESDAETCYNICGSYKKQHGYFFTP